MDVLGISPETALSLVRTAFELVARAVAGAESYRLAHDKETPDEREARMLYWEVLYNKIMLGIGQSATPPALFGTHRIWDRDFVVSAATRVMDSAGMAAIVSAYLQLSTVEWLFDQGWTRLVRDRLEGADQRALEEGRQTFSVAERAMRAKLFTDDQAKALAKAIEDLPDPEGKPFVRRLNGVIVSIPPKVAWGGLGVSILGWRYGRRRS